MEVLDALFDLSYHFARQGAKAGTYEACDVIITKPKVVQNMGRRVCSCVHVDMAMQSAVKGNGKAND